MFFMIKGRNILIGAGALLALGLTFLGGKKYGSHSDSVWQGQRDFAIKQSNAAVNEAFNLRQKVSSLYEDVVMFSNKYNEVENSNRALAARLDATGRPDSEVVAETEARLKTQYDLQLRTVNNQLEGVAQSNKTLVARLKEKDAEISKYTSVNEVAQSQSVGFEEGANINTIFSDIKIQYPLAYASIIRTTNQTAFGKSESVSLGDIHIVEYMAQDGALVPDTRSDVESLVNAFQFYDPKVVNPNRFEELAAVKGGDVNFAKKLEGDSDKYDRFAQFYAGYRESLSKTNFPGVSRFKNKNGRDIVSGPLDAIRSLRTGSRGK